MTRAYAPRVNEGGNFCGHNPRAPRLALAKPAHGRQPLVIRRAGERLADYYAKPRTIPTLAHQTTRRHRSESRESCVLLLLSLLKFTDLASLRVGIPTDAGFAPLPLKTLADHAGVGLRRAERAMAKLKAAGLLTVSQVCEKQADGSLLALPAIKAVSKHLWGCFGLADMLAAERVKAAKRDKKAGRRGQNITSRATARGSLFLEQVRAKMPGRRVCDPEQTRALQLREIELALKNPGLSLDDIKRKARHGA